MTNPIDHGQIEANEPEWFGTPEDWCDICVSAPEEAGAMRLGLPPT